MCTARVDVCYSGAAPSQLPDERCQQRADHIWTQVGRSVLQKLALSGCVPAPSLIGTTGSATAGSVGAAAVGVTSREPAMEYEQPAPIRLSSVFCKMGTQVHLPGAASRYYCVGPFYSVIDMARSDLAALYHNMRRLRHNCSTDTPTVGVYNLDKQCDVKVTVTLSERVSLYGPENISDAFIDFSAAPELRGCDRMYVVTEVVEAESISLELSTPAAGPHVHMLFRHLPLAFVYRKYRLVQATGQICHQTSQQAVATTRSQFLYRSNRARGAKSRDPGQRPSAAVQQSPAVEVPARHSHEPGVGAVGDSGDSRAAAVYNRRFNQSHIMRFPRPISSYIVDDSLETAVVDAVPSICDHHGAHGLHSERSGIRDSLFGKRTP